MAKLYPHNFGKRVKNVLLQNGFEIRGNDALRPVNSDQTKLTFPVLWKESVREEKSEKQARDAINDLVTALTAAGIPQKHIGSIRPVMGDKRIARRSRIELKKAWNFVCCIAAAAIPQRDTRVTA